jgi:LacI family transcriptional regulator
MRPPHVALIVETSTSFGRRLLRGVAHYVRENGPWSVYLEQRSIYDPAPPWLKDWDGDGIISRAAFPEIARLVVNTRITAVDLNEQVTGLGLPLIFNDHEAIGRMAAAHLLERRFTQFGFLGHAGVFWSEERRRGFRAAVEAAGYCCSEYRGTNKTLPRYHQRSWEKEMEQVAHWVDALPKPVGILAANDFRALQLLDACRRAGVPVPEKAAILGVDDEETVRDLASPPLSTVVPNAMQMGYEAAAMLDHLMHGGRPYEQKVLIPPLGIITRQSTDVTAITEPIVAEALRFIREHACEGVGVEAVVHHLAVSRSVLQRRFARVLGRTVHDVILGTKLDRVCQLLAETGLPLIAIAERAGFKHVEYLCNVFKERMDTTPTAYRRQFGRKSGESPFS